jgi:hypothetical protein
VFENRALRRIFGSKRDEVNGGCRKLHNEELHNNIKMDLREIGCGGMDWIVLAQNRDYWRVIGGNEPSASIKCWEVLE